MERHLFKYLDEYVPYMYILVNGGDNGQAFLIFNAEPEQLQPYEREIISLAREEGWTEAYWCPDPDSHIEDVKEATGEEWEEITVLNLFK